MLGCDNGGKTPSRPSFSSVWASVHAAGVCREALSTPSLISPFVQLLGGYEALGFLSTVLAPHFVPYMSSPPASFSCCLSSSESTATLTGVSSPFVLPFYFVRNLLPSWNISSNLIGKIKGTFFLIVWIDQQSFLALYTHVKWGV